MFNKKLFISFIFICASAIPASSQAGIGIDLGPFDFHIGRGAAVDNVGYVEDPICQAIRDTDLLEIFVVVDQEENSEENENAPTRLIVEPYALGVNEAGELVLRGIQVEGFDFAASPQTDSDAEADRGGGFIGGVFSSFKGANEKKDFNISKIVNIRVIENSDFTVRGKTDASSEEEGKIVQYICALNAPSVK